MPCSLPSVMAASAFGPWPCPKDTAALRSNMSSFAARRSSSAMGSAPDERTKMRGMQLLLSAYTWSKLKEGGSRYSFPNLLRMMSCKPLTVLSVRTARSTRVFCKGVKESLMPPGHGSPKGSSESKTFRQLFTFSLKRSLKPIHGSLPRSSNSETLAHDTSLSHSASGPVGLGLTEAPVVPPTKSRPFSSKFSSLSTSMLLSVRSKEYMSLFFSKSESQTFWKMISMKRVCRAHKRFCRLRSNFSAVFIPSS
mmetsp:Transcript_63983/g.137626  ORF Transcript_63983/g.137626 Transcript_63983/m.137626 type:complete len:252 (-) Transcript_63983:3148-3903(-)